MHNKIFRIFILSLITILFSCKSEITKEEAYLTKIRKIHKPVTDNFLVLKEIVDSVSKECEVANLECSTKAKNKIIQLKINQDSLNIIALSQLDSLENDKFGYKDALIGFIKLNPYNYPFRYWDLFFQNLCYCDSNNKIVKDINTSNIDTISINILGESKSFGERIIYVNTNWIGIDKTNYIKQFNLINKIYEADDWYCQINRAHLSKNIAPLD